MGKMDAPVTTSTATTDSLGLGQTLLNTAFVFIWRMSQLVLGLGTVVAVLLYYKQDSMLYFPGEHETCFTFHLSRWTMREIIRALLTIQ